MKTWYLCRYSAQFFFLLKMIKTNYEPYHSTNSRYHHESFVINIICSVFVVVVVMRLLLFIILLATGRRFPIFRVNDGDEEVAFDDAKSKKNSS